MEKAFAQRVYLFLHLWLEMLRSVRFCNSDRASITYEKTAEEIRKRVEANDAGAIYMLARHYTMDMVVLNRIMRRQLIYLIGQQIFVLVRHMDA